MKLWLLFGLGALAWAAGGESVPRIVYTKSFPGSVPAYVGITVNKAGAGEYRDTPDDDSPLKFQLSQTQSAEMFALVSKLQDFKRPLESPLKVAFTGMKTFRLENGAENNEVKFNYSQDPDARMLGDWFERISETEQHVINLERAAKYDRLGVVKALLLLEISWERKRLVDAPQFLPLLDRIVKNEVYMHTARERAAALADAIRATP